MATRRSNSPRFTPTSSRNGFPGGYSPWLFPDHLWIIRPVHRGGQPPLPVSPETLVTTPTKWRCGDLPLCRRSLMIPLPLTSATPSSGAHATTRIRFSNSWGIIMCLRAARGTLSHPSKWYNPSPWTVPEVQRLVALEPTTSESAWRPRGAQPSRRMPSTALRFGAAR